MSDDATLEVLLPFVMALFFIGLAVFMIFWTHRRAEQLLDQWAADNGVQIVQREYRLFRKGPFFWTSGRGQLVYYFIAQDRFGMQRAGWARCGSWFLGMLSDRIEVRWEE
jgi:hypothetical protein